MLQSYSFGSELSCVEGADEVMSLGGSIDCKCVLMPPAWPTIVSVVLHLRSIDFACTSTLRWLKGLTASCLPFSCYSFREQHLRE
jgi:hypothetical protein